MSNLKPINWTQIQNTCPEFIPNHWDVVLALIAFAGIVMSCILMTRFHKQMKGSVYLNNLAGVDMGYCLIYLWSYFFTSSAVYFKRNLMAEIRIMTQCEVKMIRDFYDTVVSLLIFHIIFEKFLWTCSSRTRHTWRIFTVGNYKFYLSVVTALFALFATFITSWNLLQLSDVPFCDVILLPVTIKQSFFQFLQIHFIPWVSIIATPLTFIFALVTLCRISRVGEGEKPLNQEEIEMTNLTAETPQLTTGRIKRSIICMLAIYFMFMVRGFCWYVYVNPQTTNIYSETRNTRILRSWSYDFMNVVFSGSRTIVYYVFCRKGLVVEFPANAFDNP